MLEKLLEKAKSTNLQACREAQAAALKKHDECAEAVARCAAREEHSAARIAKAQTDINQASTDIATISAEAAAAFLTDDETRIEECRGRHASAIHRKGLFALVLGQLGLGETRQARLEYLTATRDLARARAESIELQTVEHLILFLSAAAPLAQINGGDCELLLTQGMTAQLERACIESAQAADHAQQSLQLEADKQAVENQRLTNSNK